MAPVQEWGSHDLTGVRKCINYNKHTIIDHANFGSVPNVHSVTINRNNRNVRGEDLILIDFACSIYGQSEPSYFREANIVVSSDDIIKWIEEIEEYVDNKYKDFRKIEEERSIAGWKEVDDKLNASVRELMKMDSFE